jgi:hypothetical protein
MPGEVFTSARPRCDGFGLPRIHHSQKEAEFLIICRSKDEYVLDGLPSDLCSVFSNIQLVRIENTLWQSLPRVLLAYGDSLTTLLLSHNRWLINFPPNMSATFRRLHVLELECCPRLPRSLQRVWENHDPQRVSLAGRLLWVSSYHPGLLAVDAYTARCEQQRSVGVILLSRRLFGGVPVDLRRVIVRLMMQQFRAALNVI